MSEPLKPCPFCGGEAKLYKLPKEHPYVYRVACLGDCKTAYGISFSYSEKYTAIKQWNRRALDADRAALRGLVREAMALMAEWIPGHPKTGPWLTRAAALAGEPQEGKEEVK